MGCSHQNEYGVDAVVPYLQILIGIYFEGLVKEM
jgi:hypothetical protein